MIRKYVFTRQIVTFLNFLPLEAIMYQQVQKEIKQMPEYLGHKQVIKRQGRNIPSNIANTNVEPGKVWK